MIKKIFYSYSHKDKEILSKLRVHLALLIQQYQIEEFVDTQINCGNNLDENIMTNLEESDLVILLLSPDYLASEYCQKEMNIAIGANKAVPIVARTCDWKTTPLINIKALPEDGKPIVEYESVDTACQYITDKLRNKINASLYTIKCRKEFSQKLQEIDFLHPNKSTITLEDTFVQPNINSNEGKRYDTIQKIINNDKYREILFHGSSYSGKSAILKYIYIYLLQQNIFPLYIQGGSITKTKYFDDEIKKIFNEQYDGNFTFWEKNDVKYILIDDYHHSISQDFYDYLQKYKNIKLIITIEEEEYISFFKDFECFGTFERFKIEPFNRKQQEEIIKKWLLLKDNNIQSDFYNKVDIIEKQINEIVSSQNILQRYPTNILLILQAIDGRSSDIQITSYGHCYYSLILNYLDKNGIVKDNVDASMNFLSELSYDIFNCKEEYTQERYKEFKKEYENNFIINKSVLSRLETANYPILRFNQDNGSVKFEHEFIYYYFLGKNLSEKISSKDIEFFCDNIHQKIHMYIIVFIIHHSKNMELIEEIILRCMLVLDKVKEASYLSDETHGFITNLDIPQIILNAKSIEDNRIVEREIIDDANIDNIDDANIDSMEDINNNEIYKGMKLSEVLSQILKNRSGSFSTSKVKEILDSIIGIRLRINKLLFKICEDKEFEGFLTNSLKGFLKHDNRNISDEKAKKFVEKLTRVISFGGSFEIVNDVSFLVYTDNIMDNLDKLIETIDKPSREIILFLTSIKSGFRERHFNQLSKLKEKYEKEQCFFANKILSYSMQHYLNTHSVDKYLGLKVCKLFKLPIINRNIDKLFKTNDSIISN
ncbi:TIR domain-containing protein [Campylobacter coli]|uniref:TIR domain-containing protein n=1 Tax=Campylobacter coli TaxID=195 RepID=UPI0009318FD3|nr:toll/interleukin-1 receptor domain-containing protein [Campylobacter coli]